MVVYPFFAITSSTLLRMDITKCCILHLWCYCRLLKCLSVLLCFDGCFFIHSLLQKVKCILYLLKVKSLIWPVKPFTLPPWLSHTFCWQSVLSHYPAAWLKSSLLVWLHLSINWQAKCVCTHWNEFGCDHGQLHYQ